MITHPFKNPLHFLPHLVVLTLLLSSVACTDSRRSESGRKNAEWNVGYWYWQGRGRADAGAIGGEEVPIDLLYVQVGDYRTGTADAKPQAVRMDWPGRVPKAHAYVAVFRCEGPVWVDGKIVPGLAGGYESLKERAARTGQTLKGLQIDCDCPTKELDRYGRFLADLRKALSREDSLSITALLDWFRPGTKVAEVIRSTDEFVPQFYDVDPKKLDAADGGIAEPIDPVRWAPVFNTHRKPYRVGIASFGRIIQQAKARDGAPSPGEPNEWVTVGDSPIELIAWDKGAFVPYGTSAAGETIARFKGDRDEMVKMIIPTSRSVASAYRAAEAMGGYCSGVLFFRYPSRSEALALSPAEVSRMISGKEPTAEAAAVEADDGFCATVSCSDLFVRLGERFPPKDLVLTIQSSHDLDYFVPGRLVQARLRGPRLIEVRIPAYAGVPRIPVGRAVSADPARFTVEKKP